MSNVVDLSIITSAESEALKQFKEIFPDIIEKLSHSPYKSHDLWLLRWLRARELDVIKAEEMLRKSLDWRAVNKIDEILSWEVPDFLYQEFPLKATGIDKDGCVIAIIPYGKWDVQNAVSLGMKDDLIRFVDLMFEQVMKFLERQSTPDKMILQFVMIFDIEGFSVGQLACRQTIDTLLEVVRLFEENHPETLKAAFVVNAPKVFEVLFALIKPLLTARTVSKIQVYGSNSVYWRAALLENIEPDQLPSQYGGTNSSCKSYKVSDGFDVFQVYDTLPENTFIPAIVEAGGKKVVSFFLCKDNKLSWNFRSTDYDIGFQVQFSSSNLKNSVDPSANANAEIIFEFARADSHLRLQKGAFVADKPGTYSLVFDNSFSRFRQKSISYSARVTDF